MDEKRDISRLSNLMIVSNTFKRFEGHETPERCVRVVIWCKYRSLNKKSLKFSNTLFDLDGWFRRWNYR